MGQQISEEFEIEQLRWENIAELSRRCDPSYTDADLMDMMREAQLETAIIMLTVWRIPKLN